MLADNQILSNYILISNSQSSKITLSKWEVGVACIKVSYYVWVKV